VRDVPAPRAAGERAPQPPQGDSWDVTGISGDELAAVRRFLDRRHQLESEPRNRLARQLADGLRAKVGGAPESLSPENFLEALAAAKSRRS
jgi:hypothetical protein